MSDKDSILLECRDSIAIVTLNRPEQRNAFDASMCDQLRKAFDQIEADNSILCSVIVGNGPAFCAGMDLKAFVAGDADKMLFGEYGFAGFVKRKRKKPVIAAVEGAALAGGFELMLACDMVVASESAKFGLPESKLGLVAAGGGAIRLGQRVPRFIANQILLTGRVFGAQDALEWGLVNNVVSNGEALDCATQLAQEISQNAPSSIQASLALADFAASQVEQQLWEANDQQMQEIGKTNDAKEGPTAFIEKRKPVWRGE